MTTLDDRTEETTRDRSGPKGALRRSRLVAGAGAVLVLALALLGGWLTLGDDAGDPSAGGQGADVGEEAGAAGVPDEASIGSDSGDGVDGVGGDDAGAPTSFGAVEEGPEGSYEYDVLVEADGRSESSERTVTLGGPVEVDGERRQDIAYGTGQRDERSWMADGIAVRVTHFGDRACEWDTPWLQYPLPLEVGASWRTRAECEASDDRATLRASVIETVRVIGTRTRRVGDQTVAVAVIERERTLSISGAISEAPVAPPTEFRAIDTSTEEFAPGHGLVVHSTTLARRSSLEGMSEATETMTLRSLQPR